MRVVDMTDLFFQDKIIRQFQDKIIRQFQDKIIRQSTRNSVIFDCQQHFGQTLGGGNLEK